MNVEAYLKRMAQRYGVNSDEYRTIAMRFGK